MIIQDFTPSQIAEALLEISKMDHYTMCRLWRFGCDDDKPYFRSDLPTGEAFKERLFTHFGGFTPEISKSLGFSK